MTYRINTSTCWTARKHARQDNFNRYDTPCLLTPLKRGRAAFPLPLLAVLISHSLFGGALLTVTLPLHTQNKNVSLPTLHRNVPSRRSSWIVTFYSFLLICFSTTNVSKRNTCSNGPVKPSSWNVSFVMSTQQVRLALTTFPRHPDSGTPKPYLQTFLTRFKRNHKKVSRLNEHRHPPYKRLPLDQHSTYFLNARGIIRW